VDAQLREGLDVSFSEDAIQDLYMQVMTWVGTRILRFHQESGVMPQTAQIRLTVDLTHKPVTSVR
jgi:hypothetical protein